METVRDVQSRGRRDVHGASSSSQNSSYHLDETHGAAEPPSVTTSLTDKHLPPGDHDQPLAVEPVGRGLSSEIRRNPLKDIGALIVPYRMG